MDRAPPAKPSHFGRYVHSGSGRSNRSCPPTTANGFYEGMAEARLTLRLPKLEPLRSCAERLQDLANRAYCAGFVVAFGTGLSRQTTCCFGPRPPLVPPLLVVPLVPPLEPVAPPRRRRQSLSDSQPM